MAHQKRGKGLPARMAAWGAFAAGAALLVYSLLHSSDEGIPGWQPANESLQAAASAQASLQPPAVSSSTAGSAASRAANGSPAPTPNVPASGHAAVLDLNAATEAELDGLPGIGSAKAKTILAYRESHRGFRSVEELLQVKGIGPKLLEKIRPLVAVVPSANGT